MICLSVGSSILTLYDEKLQGLLFEPSLTLYHFMDTYSLVIRDLKVRILPILIFIAYTQKNKKLLVSLVFIKKQWITNEIVPSYFLVPNRLFTTYHQSSIAWFFTCIYFAATESTFLFWSSECSDYETSLGRCSCCQAYANCCRSEPNDSDQISRIDQHASFQIASWQKRFPHWGCTASGERKSTQNARQC